MRFVFILRDIQGNTPLHIAVESRNKHMVEELLGIALNARLLMYLS